jgi:hypothetical protein
MARHIRVWSRNRRRNYELAAMIEKAIGEIDSLDRRASAFVKTTTILNRHSLDPTDHQSDLLIWIRRRGFVPAEVTLGMNFMFLGGLMARGLVVATTKDGVEGVEAV